MKIFDHKFKQPASSRQERTMVHLKRNILRELLISFFILLCLLITLPAPAQFSPPAPVRTPQNVIVNKTLPKGVLAPDQQLVVHFSVNPTDEEIYRVHLFEEPLVPTEDDQNSANSEYIRDENVDLVNALAAFSQRTSLDDFSALNNYLQKYPAGRWRGALLSNLGIVYRRTGYYSEAMNSWQIAWDLMKNQTAPKVKVLADRVLSELLYIHSWVGRYESIESLLEEIDGRMIEGPAVERIIVTRESLWLMKNKPEGSFKCGPFALNEILFVKEGRKPFNEKLREVKSPMKGFSLTELLEMAREVELDYQMAYRKPGAEVILNSVIHWKLDHYSALLKKENGQYGCQDATVGTRYGQKFWLTPSALDSSASGYFLIPKGPLPKGWRKVNSEEGSHVFGKGVAPADNQHHSKCDIQAPQCKSGSPMAQSNVHVAAVSLHIFDQPLYYTPPRGPSIVWDVRYHQRDSYQAANFSYSHLGPKWTFEYLSYVQDNPNNPSEDANIYLPGGGLRSFADFSSVTQSYIPELQSGDVLARISGDCYELRHPDGSKDVYSRPDGSTVAGRKVFMTQMVDATGNALTILYDNNLRIIGLQDAIGQVTTISYEDATDIYKITKVTDPFARFATFKYDSLSRLNKITDMIGITSSFKYEKADFISQMTTPYGVTSFVSSEDFLGLSRSVETTYPMGEKERVEFQFHGPKDGSIIIDTVAPTGMNIYIYGNSAATRNTYFWDKKAMKDAPGDYSKARIYHWLVAGNAPTESIAPILESYKDPLENRVWYNYQNQVSTPASNEGMSPQPSAIGRVLDDKVTTQLTKFRYNSIGAVISSTDPFGRRDTFKYDTNNIDLLEVRQITGGANELLAKFTYNSQHLPLTAINASGQTTTFTYNESAQLLSATNPKHETTTLSYDPDGYLLSIIGPVSGSTVSFTYDGFGRVRTVTDPEGYTITTDYDALDRPTLITYPDNTFEQIGYDRLDAVHMRDRLGRWSHTKYDSLDRPSIMQDALGRITQFIWCACGSLEAIVDPLKQITTFNRDLQGRVTAKIYPDGKVISYKYENTISRLKEITDSKGQKTQYQYFKDDNLKQIEYVNDSIPTPSVFFTYDSKYNRLTTMTDGTGLTTYAYNSITLSPTPGAGQLRMIDGPLSNDTIHYSYDSLGRVISRFINGLASTSSMVYDKLGRITSATNALGSFTYSYVNQTYRLSSITMPFGLTTTFDYFNNAGDQRLKQILNKKGGTTLSKFNYEYNAEGQITKWTQKAGSATPEYYEFQYDLADQLVSAVLKNQNTAAIVRRYAYNYDRGGNRISEQVDNGVTSATHNNTNQLTSLAEGGPLRLKGEVDEFSVVTVDNETTSSSATATVNANNQYEASIDVDPGPNIVKITTTDYSGNNNQKIDKYQITVSNGVNKTLTYDYNGNTKSIVDQTSTISYDWDAADRLVKITKPGSTTEFVYDGLSRRVAEKLDGIVIKRWLWCGTELCEERDEAGGTVTKRFFPQGQKNAITKYFYTRDHIGSIRELIDSTGIVKARYDYDPYGRRSANLITNNPVEADFGFTGHYFHPSSGLHLALYRAYDADLGRWVSRDPLGEDGGFNVYHYVLNNPTKFTDPLGLTLEDQGIENSVQKSYSSPGGPCLSSCLADVALNFGLGFIPGYNAISFVADLNGAEINPFQAIGGVESFWTAEPTIPDAAAGTSDLIAQCNAISPRDKQQLKNLEDWTTRKGFNNKSPSKQLKDINKLGSLMKVSKLASSLGTIANLLNVASAAFDVAECYKKCKCK